MGYMNLAGHREQWEGVRVAGGLEELEKFGGKEGDTGQ